MSYIAYYVICHNILYVYLMRNIGHKYSTAVDTTVILSLPSVPFRLIKMSSPNINNIILSGCAVMYSSVYLQQLDVHHVTSICMVISGVIFQCPLLLINVGLLFQCPLLLISVGLLIQYPVLLFTNQWCTIPVSSITNQCCTSPINTYMSVCMYVCVYACMYA